MNVPLEAHCLINEFSREYCFCVVLDHQVVQLSQAMINALGPEYANLQTCSGLQNIVQVTRPLLQQARLQDELIPFQHTFFVNSLAFASTGIQRLPTSVCIYFVYFVPVLNSMPLPQKHLNSQDRHILQKRLYEISILQALDELQAAQFQGLELHFQPRLDSVTHEFHSLELLIRWKNKEFGFIPPMDFIPIAERSGHIHLLGRWILDQVINLQTSLVQQGFLFVLLLIFQLCNLIKLL
ncbi:EAL domain-containing protein [Allopseudospirillum japonicum]|uniref:EAL domain-containing protein n=1 Tax=Allopseudospirillum japonicum TaxID=64971 RepID=A0A1H6Q4Y6_9GAMM|nr:EAL domain-containing protein [Allopseudospirillum japonicum]SEI38889.1 EAL domain-containing protein [Allopseudospirillum japonicum]